VVDQLLLALDTSTSTAGVAVYDGQRVLSETTWLAGREHSTRLLAEVGAALGRIGREPAHLTGLVVARGPGSFTGVRVALSVAKGIASGLGLPLWGVNSLEMLVRAAGATDLPVLAVLEAGRGRYAIGLYRAGVAVDEARTTALDDLVARIREPTLLIGDLDGTARGRLASNTLARMASPAACLRRAGYLAELGWLAAEAGEPGDPKLVDAVYLAPRASGGQGAPRPPGPPAEASQGLLLRPPGPAAAEPPAVGIWLTPGS
jgi:tRNA threonylcarbamoyladenosine biosynthesis protein TsaB